MFSQYLAFIIGFNLLKNQMLFSEKAVYPNFLEKFAKNSPLTQVLLREEPLLSAQSYLVIDKSSSDFLMEKNIYEKMKIASLTKLMTALIILEENNLEDIVVVKKDVLKVEGVKMWLNENERISVRNLLYGALISSANDAAEALAYYNAGDIKSFVDKMNKRAYELGLKNTHFENPVGFDNEENYSSARDIGMLVLYLSRKPFFKEVTSIEKIKVFSYNKKISHELENTNRLLKSYLDIIGGKTGTTKEAKQCLVAIIDPSASLRAGNSGKRELIIVILGSENRWLDIKTLMAATYNNYPGLEK